MRSQSGIAQVLLLLMLVAGVIVGTYVVQNRTYFLPHAEETCIAWNDSGCIETKITVNPEPEQKKNESPAENNRDQSTKDTGLADQRHGEQNPNQSSGNQGGNPPDGTKDCPDNITYCQNGKAIHKHGGYKDTSSQFADKNGCIYDFYPVTEEDSSCSSDKGAKDGSVVKDNPELIQQKNIERNDKGIASQCQSIVYCDNGQAFKKITVWDDKANKCSDPQITPVSSVDNKCKDKDGKAAAQGTVIATEDTSKKPEEQGYYASTINQDVFKASSDLQRNDLKGFIEGAKVEAITDPALKTKVQADLKAAQDALAAAKTAADACKTEADCSSAFAANTKAVALSRAALAEAIAAGVPDLTVKADLNIGGNNKNTSVYARATSGSGGSRVFAQSQADGTVKYVVRNDAGQLVDANADDLKAAGLTQKQTPAQFATWSAPRLTNVSAVTNITPSSTTASQPNSLNISPVSQNKTEQIPALEGYKTSTNFAEPTLTRQMTDKNLVINQNIFREYNPNSTECQNLNCPSKNLICTQNIGVNSNGGSSPRYSCVGAETSGQNKPYMSKKYVDGKECNGVCQNGQKCVLYFSSATDTARTYKYICEGTTASQPKNNQTNPGTCSEGSCP